MADRNDLSGPYEEHLDLSTMSKEFLIGLLGVWSNSYASLNKGLFGALLKRMPIEEAAEVIVVDLQKLDQELAGVILEVTDFAVEGPIKAVQIRFFDLIFRHG